MTLALESTGLLLNIVNYEPVKNNKTITCALCTYTKYVCEGGGGGGEREEHVYVDLLSHSCHHISSAGLKKKDSHQLF